jgi:hypothetical protein
MSVLGSSARNTISTGTLAPRQPRCRLLRWRDHAWPYSKWQSRHSRRSALRERFLSRPHAEPMTSTAQPSSNAVTAADCYHVHGRGENRGNAGVNRAEVITHRLVQDERGWLRLVG